MWLEQLHEHAYYFIASGTALFIASLVGVVSRRQVEKSKNQLQAVLSSMAEGLLVCDNRMCVVSVNQTAGKLLRRAPAELMGRPITQVLQLFKKDQPLLFEEIITQKVLLQSEIINLSLNDNIYCQNKGGQVFPAALLVAPLVVKSLARGAVVLLRDISDEKGFDVRKTEFVSLASHQLRTPLSSGRWYAEMLLNGDAGPMKRKQRQYVQEIYKAAERMSSIVNMLLQMTQLELGMTVIDPRVVNIKTAMVDLLEQWKEAAAKKKQRLQLTIGSHLAAVAIDFDMLQIIICQLVSNAIKYTPEHGVITMKVVRAEDQLIVEVTDTGYGIPKALQNKLFTKLARFRNIEDKDTTGSGVGLFIVKAIVEKLQGTISVDSAENRGSRFTVSLPLVVSNKK